MNLSKNQAEIGILLHENCNYGIVHKKEQSQIFVSYSIGGGGFVNTGNKASGGVNTGWTNTGVQK